MIGIGAIILACIIAVACIVTHGLILDRKYFKQKEAWRTDPNFKWNWN